MTERRRPHDPDVTARCLRVRAVMEAHGCSVETALAHLIERGEVPAHVRPNKVRCAMKIREIDSLQPGRQSGQPELRRPRHRRSEALAAKIHAQCERSKAVGRRIEQKPARSDYDRIINPAGLIPDEPVFLIRGNDVAAPATLRFWAALARSRGVREDIVQKAFQQAEEMKEWQRNRESKVPDLPRGSEEQAGE